MILVIDNRPLDWNEEFILLKVLEEMFGERFEVVHYESDELANKIMAANVEAIISGGSPELITKKEVRKRFQPEINLLGKVRKPILGICHGHQLLTLAYGGEVSIRRSMVKGFRKIRVLKQDPIFEGLDDSFMGWKEHREEVRRLPEKFILLAESDDCAVEAIKLQNFPIYGLQFHPERFNDEHPEGLRILENFMKIVEYYKDSSS